MSTTAEPSDGLAPAPTASAATTSHGTGALGASGEAPLAMAMTIDFDETAVQFQARLKAPTSPISTASSPRPDLGPVVRLAGRAQSAAAAVGAGKAVYKVQPSAMTAGAPPAPQLRRARPKRVSARDVPALKLGGARTEAEGTDGPGSRRPAIAGLKLARSASWPSARPRDGRLAS